VLRFKASLNRRSVKPAEYAGSGCIGCGICFYNCPEPFAIEVHTASRKTAK
jgi:NAD-dependent dihydropyrimidine dehydrogenase PreA subunit